MIQKHKISFLFGCFFILNFGGISLWSQTQKIKFEYKIKYLVQNKKKNTTDTLQIHIAENGKYIYTNHKPLFKAFVKDAFGSFGINSDRLVGSLIYNPLENKIMLNCVFGDNVFYINVNMSEFIPKSTSKNPTEKRIAFEETQKTKIIDGKKYPVYKISTIGTPETFFLVTDPSIAIDNSVLFKNLLEVAVPNLKSLELPEGLILAMFPKKLDEYIFKAFIVNDSNLKINISPPVNIEKK